MFTGANVAAVYSAMDGCFICSVGDCDAQTKNRHLAELNFKLLHLLCLAIALAHIIGLKIIQGTLKCELQFVQKVYSLC